MSLRFVSSSEKSQSYDGSKHCWQLFKVLLAENDRSHCNFCLVSSTVQVVPLSFYLAWTIHVSTFLSWTARFTSVPCSITGQRTSVCPVKLSVCLAVKSQPGSMCCSFFLLGEKVDDEPIFGGRRDFSEVSSQLLTISSNIVPLQRWNVDDKVTRLSIRNPSSGTCWFCWEYKNNMIYNI